MELRKHQSLLVEALDQAGGSPLRILMHVVPGGGKSWLPKLVLERFPKLKVAWFVPRLTLARQAAGDYQKPGCDIRLRETKGEYDPCRGTRGFVATHQALVSSPEMFIDELERHEYLVVVDELHHSKIQRDGIKRPLATVLERLPYAVRLNMTGTLETNDKCLIEDVQYSETRGGKVPAPESSANIFIRYTRKEALLEHAVVPIDFWYYDGEVKYADADGIKQFEMSKAGTIEEDKKALFTALRTEVAEELFKAGVRHWREYGDKLIVVADSQDNATKYQKKLEEMRITTALAIHENENAAMEIRKFRERDDYQAMATCQMAYEGLDVPRATHLIALTHIRSVPWIEQMLGRVWRAAPKKTRCYAFVPADRRMASVVERIREEQLIEIPDEIEGEGPDEGDAPDVVVALGSTIGSVNVVRLDTDYKKENPLHQGVRELLEDRGVAEASVTAAVVEFIRKQVEAERGPEKEGETVRESEARLRTEIGRLCNLGNQRRIERLGIDVEEKDDRRFYQSLLKSHTGKGTPGMCVEELEKSAVKLRQLIEQCEAQEL